MDPRPHTLLPLAAIAGLALAASAAANTEIITNFYTSTSGSKGALTTGGLYSTAQLAANTASPFAYEYDISGLGLGAANKLKVTVATTGANLNNGGNNGIAVVGGNNSWWEEQDGALSFTVVIEDASNADITSNFNIDLTGAAIRWVNTVSPAPAVTLSVAGAPSVSYSVLNQAVNLPTGQTAETSFSATRTGNTTGQFQQLRFVITDPNSDVTAPTITTKNPADEASGVAVDANLVATFDEYIALTGTGSVTIRDLGPGPDLVITLPDARVSVSGANLIINPTTDLLPNNPYAVRISASAIKDLATTPNAFTGILDDTEWNFVTVLVDNTAPTIASKLPDDEATDVAPNSNLVATFDENIALTGTGTITIRDLGPGPDVVIPLPDARVSVSGKNLIINPTTDLLASTPYAVQISATAVKDLATIPNAFAGILDDTTWNFSTAAPDITAPTITGKSPADNAVSVLNDATLVATFDENIALTGTGSVTIRDLGPGPDVVITLPDAQVSVSGANLIINPTTDLVPNNPYAVQISANAVKDLATVPNAFAGILDDTTWNFSTLPGLRVVANFNTAAQPIAALQGGLYSSTALGAATATPFTFVYDISSLGLGAADKLKITVATTGAALNNGGANGIAVVGGNDGWWEETDGALSYTVVIEDAVNADITGNFNIDLTGAAIRWVNTTPSITLNVAGAGPFSYTAQNQAMDLPTGQSAETSFSASRTGNTIGQFQQLRFAISESAGGNLFADWISGKPGVGGQTGLNQDPDGDGIDNGVENFFGTEPGVFSKGLLAGTMNPGAGTFTFTHPQGTLATDLTAAYQWSKDLQSFNAGGATDGGGTKVDFSVQPDTPVAGTTTVTATVTGTATSKLFVGVKVTQN
jgi:hypothetical protein